MRKRLIILLLLCACHKQKPATMQTVKDEKGFHFDLSYMPPKAASDLDLLRFRLKISSSNGTALSGTDAPVFSYGLDSLFTLNTHSPVDVMRVANGNIGGVEYLLVFPRPAAVSSIIFKDWLFLHQVTTFPIDGAAIKHIDSLSLNL